MGDERPRVMPSLAETAAATWTALQGLSAPVGLLVFGSSVSSPGRDVDLL